MHPPIIFRCMLVTLMLSETHTCASLYQDWHSTLLCYPHWQFPSSVTTWCLASIVSCKGKKMKKWQSDTAKLWLPMVTVGSRLCSTVHTREPRSTAQSCPPLVPQNGASGSSVAKQDFNETCDVQVHALEHRYLTFPRNRMSWLEDREWLTSVNSTFPPMQWVRSWDTSGGVSRIEKGLMNRNKIRVKYFLSVWVFSALKNNIHRVLHEPWDPTALNHWTAGLVHHRRFNQIKPRSKWDIYEGQSDISI